MQNISDLEQLTSANRDFLVALWREIIGAQDITIESDFFQLGGDSLQMMTMLYRIQEETRLDLSPGCVFENPTLGQLATFLAGEQLRGDTESAEVTL